MQIATRCDRIDLTGALSPIGCLPGNGPRRAALQNKANKVGPVDAGSDYELLSIVDPDLSFIEFAATTGEPRE